MNYKKEKGITLIALVITIIILIILAGISINLLLGKYGIINKAKTAQTTYQEQAAKEKLELELASLYADKQVNKDYNENEYLTKKLSEKGFIVNGNVVIVEGYQFQIDRSVPKIEIYLGKEENTENINIGTAEQLINFRNNVNSGETYEGKTIILTNNIDLSSVCGANTENWVPIGTQTNPFKGNFNGNNCTINSLYINDTDNNYQGLFGFVNSGTVKNIIVKGSVKGGTGSAGIVAYIKDGIIDNCINEANITHTNNYIYSENSKANITYIGGVSGLVEGTTQITNSFNKGEVTSYATGADYILGGGIAGWISENENGVIIQKCSNSGKIQVKQINESTGYLQIGGIAGGILGGNIIQCNNIGDICTAETSNITEFNGVGGIVGSCGKVSSSLNSKVEQCWNAGNIESSVSGGIVGVNYSGYTISNNYNTGKVICNYKCGIKTDLCPTVGGICGWNRLGTIDKCYNKGETQNNGCGYASNAGGIGTIGGIVGCNNSNINDVYNVAVIKAIPSTMDARGTVAGGIIGLSDENSNFKNCYNTGEILTNKDTITYIGGTVGWNINNIANTGNIYNIGKLSENSSYRGRTYRMAS